MTPDTEIRCYSVKTPDTETEVRQWWYSFMTPDTEIRCYSLKTQDTEKAVVSFHDTRYTEIRCLFFEDTGYREGGGILSWHRIYRGKVFIL